ncbi:alternate signal-mediated exported protein, CPF_0494 family [Ruminococcaceae bacterium FB2012]|nr:alternate signal-mediated exported protein, CPF_0494 family [Ruminococcaceae bacterium FB2012]
MSTNKKKKSAKEKRILIASVLVAATIVAGSTFAWFTSKDEVTNRLSASADYNVSITEDFTPPEDWTPGQKINKDVSAVNTGNVDAFVRLGLLHDASLTVKGTGVAVPADATALASADKTNWVELKTSASNANTPTGGNAVNNSANEVTLLQAGGTLVIAGGQVVTPSDAWNVRSGDSTNTDYSGTGQFDPAVTKTVADSTKTYAQKYGSGLYIFKRNVTDGVKYSGYYYDATGDKFYELEQEPGTVYIANLAANAITEDANGVVTLANDALDNVKLAATKEVKIKNDGVITNGNPVFDITWVQASGTEAVEADKSDATIIRLTYAGDITTGTDAAIDDVVIDINLASDWYTYWTYKAATSTKIDGTNDVGYFFYKKLLAPGATSEKLVDSVTLNGAVTQEAYKDLVYDLTVVLDSIQASPDEAKSNESIVAAVNGASWEATASYNGTTVSWS